MTSHQTAELKETRLLTAKEVGACAGHKLAKLYADVQVGLLPQPIRRGRKFSRWPSDEVEAIVRARVAGADDGAIRALVQHLHELRTAGRHA